MFLHLVLTTEPMYDGYYHDGNYYGDHGNVIYPRTNSQSQSRIFNQSDPGTFSQSDPRNFSQSEPRNFNQLEEVPDSPMYLDDTMILTNHLALSNRLPPIEAPSGTNNQNGAPMGMQNFGYEYDESYE